MDKQNTWLDPHEAAELLQIRTSRVAQLMRTGLLPYQTTAEWPLIHMRHARHFGELFPDLLEHFRVEKEVNNEVDAGGLSLRPESCLRPSTVKVLRCVQRHQANIPM